MPDEMEEIEIAAHGGKILIGNLLKDAGLVASTSEAIRMIRQGAVRIDGEKIEDTSRTCGTGTTSVYQVGKRRFARVTVSG